MYTYIFSDYNYIRILPDERTLIWNTFTGSLFILEKTEYNDLIQFSGESFKQNLNLYIKSGIIIENVNSNQQFETLVAQRKSAYSSLENINFRILPTTACNAECPYCYEKNIKAVSMTEKDVKNIVTFITNQAKQYKRINIFWFGGEPLLFPETISSFTKKLIQKNQNKEFYFDMTTNGILFDYKTARKASEEWHISEVQISLDGTKYIYEKTKNYKNVENSFQVILENISNLLDVGIRVIIRLNVNKNNTIDLKTLIHNLHDLFGNKIDIYAYPLFNTDFYSDLVISKNEITTSMIGILSTLKKCGYIKNIINFKEPISCSCTSLFPNNFVIMPNGDLMKCPSEIGQHTILGNVIDGVIDVTRNNLWSTTAIENQCKKCCFLPVCQGGCLATKMCNSATYRCCLEKYMLDELIDKFYMQELT